MPETDLKSLLKRLELGGAAQEQEIASLLDLSDPAGIRLLFDAAARVRARHFGNRIFFYGFLYFSTFCRNKGPRPNSAPASAATGTRSWSPAMGRMLYVLT